MTTFQKIVLVIAIVILLAIAGTADRAGAATWATCDKQQVVPIGNVCTRAFTARKQPTTFTAERRTNWKGYGATWLDGAKSFMTSYRGCRMFGRYRDVRVIENICDGRLRVKVRSVGVPTRVLFRWQIEH